MAASWRSNIDRQAHDESERRRLDRPLPPLPPTYATGGLAPAPPTLLTAAVREQSA